MTTVALNLPRPPSVNNLFVNVPGKGRIKSADYRNWIATAGWMLKAQRPASIKGGYRVLILVGPTRADLGNCEKALSDLLQTHGVIENDRLCQGIALERSNDVPKDVVHCVVQEAEADTWISLGDAVRSALSNIGKVA